MRVSLRSRHVLALVSCGAVVAGLAGLPAGPASALSPTQVYVAEGVSNASSDCTVTSGSSSVFPPPKTLHNGKAKGGVNLVTTWTNGTDSTDVTTVSGHYGGSTHLTKHNGALSRATVSGSGRVTITRALGGASTCAVSAQLLNAIETITTQPTGWYYVTRSTVKGSLAETLISKDTTTLTHPLFFEGYQGGKGTVTQRAFVTHGTYVTLLAAGIEAGDFPILNTKAANTNTLTAVFHKAGSAFSATSGSADKFVKFPGSVSCSHHSASLTWRGSASQVASSAFYVNGKKKASVTNPNGGHRVVLKHLGSTDDNTISVKLSLKSGGAATASRLYVPCKG